MGFLQKIFGGGGQSATYKHIDFRAKVTIDSSPIVLTYDATSTMLVDEINLVIQNVGNRAVESYCVIIDDSSNKQVGKKITFIAPLALGVLIIKGLSASIQRGRRYRFEIGHVADDTSLLTVPATQVVTFKNNIQLHAYDVTDPIWRVPSSVSGKFYSIGGWQAYKSNGTFTRTIDVGVIASQLKQDGFIKYSDIVPSGTSLNVDLYFTDNSLIASEPTLANWGFHLSNVSDGQSLPKHRYWRVVFTMQSNKSLDFTPEIADFSIEYRPEPKTFGTVLDTTRDAKIGYFIKTKIPMLSQSSLRIKNKGSKTLSSFNLQSTKVNPRFQASIDGGFTAIIAEDAFSSPVFSRNLTNKVCQIKIGFRGVKNKILMYSAKLSDVTFSKGSFTISASDHFTEFKTKIPASKAALSWSNSITYNIGNKVVFFGGLYAATTVNTASQPDISPLDWNAVGGAWADIIYDETTHPLGTKWHLADIALDIIKNHINIHSSKIDDQSFKDSVLRFPNRIGTLILRKPVSADKVITDISWFLESHVIQSSGKITLIPEPSLKDGIDIVEIEEKDILGNSLTYRSGWKDIKNQAIILTAYDNNPSQTSDHFNDGEVVVDADSVAEFDIVTTDVFKDRFNIDPVELQIRASTFVNKWKRGRGVVKFTTNTRFMDLDVLNVVNLTSNQLPVYRNKKFSGIIIDKDIDWLNQKIKLTLLEVK